MLKTTASSFFSFLQFIHLVVAVAIVALVLWVAFAGETFVSKHTSNVSLAPIVTFDGNDIATSSDFDDRMNIQSPIIGDEPEKQLAQAASFVSHHWLGFLALAISTLLGAFLWWQTRLCLFCPRDEDGTTDSYLHDRLKIISGIFLGMFIADLVASLLMATSLLPIFPSFLPVDPDFLSVSLLDSLKFDLMDFVIPHFTGATALALSLVCHLFAARLKELAVLKVESAFVV